MNYEEEYEEEYDELTFVEYLIDRGLLTWSEYTSSVFSYCIYEHNYKEYKRHCKEHNIISETVYFK